MSTRTFLGAAIFFASSAVAAGCGEAKFHETRHSQVLHVAASAVRVATENGSIAVVAKVTAEGPRAVSIDAEIRATTAERLAAVKIVAERGEGGTLSVRAEWPDGGRESSEGCSFEITLPDAKGVEARTANGSIRVVGISGSADLRTSNGAITAKGPLETVTARTSNGSVEITGATGKQDVESSNGGITVALAPENPGPVLLASSNGAVRLTVGRAFRGALNADTSNGKVEVTGFGAAGDTVSAERVSLSVGEGGEPSRIHTSNGAVHVVKAVK